MKLNKDAGSSGVIDLFPMFFCVLFGAFLFVNFGYYVKYLDILNNLDNISHKYMLIMETTGGLTEEDKDRLYCELESLGIEKADVDVSGTTFYSDEIGYGDEICLKMKILVPCKFFFMGDDMSIDDNEGKREVYIFKCAIALS